MARGRFQEGDTAMKKQILSAALVAAFATGLVTASFAQTAGKGSPQGSQGAGSVSGTKSDTMGANPSNPNGTSAGANGATTGNGTGTGR